jgi:hypothetical protein
MPVNNKYRILILNITVNDDSESVSDENIKQ